MEEFAHAIDKVIAQINERYPKMDEQSQKEIMKLCERLKKSREEIKSNNNGNGYSQNPFQNSQYLKNLRDVLILYKKWIIPSLIHQETSKLQTVKALAESVIK